MPLLLFCRARHARRGERRARLWRRCHYYFDYDAMPLLFDDDFPTRARVDGAVADIDARATRADAYAALLWRMLARALLLLPC